MTHEKTQCKGYKTQCKGHTRRHSAKDTREDTATQRQTRGGQLGPFSHVDHRTRCRMRKSVRRARDGRSVICTRAPAAYATDALSYAQERPSRATDALPYVQERPSRTRRTLCRMLKSVRRIRDGRSVICPRASVAYATDALPYAQERPSRTRQTPSGV